MINLLRRVGCSTIKLFFRIFSIFSFACKIISSICTPFYYKSIFAQIVNIGFFSLPVIGLTAIFSGAVLALQSYSGFSRFNAESAIATVVVLSITRELAPVFVGLMIAGRSGAAISAEIGTMKVTEQIDALYTLSVNPFKYLFVPRMLAILVSMPLLVLIADIIGIMGGYLVSTNVLGFSSDLYIKNTFEFLKKMDVISGMIKSVFFGFIIVTMSCYYGYNSRGGAEGVGKATTNAVVLSSISILISNYILTDLLFS